MPYPCLLDLVTGSACVPKGKLNDSSIHFKLFGDSLFKGLKTMDGLYPDVGQYMHGTREFEIFTTTSVGGKAKDKEKSAQKATDTNAQEDMGEGDAG